MKSRRGGARPGAGRKKSDVRRHDPPHRARRALAENHPVHAVLRAMPHVPRLREQRVYRATRAVLAFYLGRDDFRVVHASIQSTHFHFLVEAAGRIELSRGMRSLTIRLARAINAANGSYGQVFAHRYHDTQITTARQARNAIAYVLNNWRKHREDLASPKTLAAKLDPYASGFAFDGWSENGRPVRFVPPAGYAPLPVSPPRTSLLRSDWRWFGTIDVLEVPGSPPV